MASSLNEEMKFESDGDRVTIAPSDFVCNFRWHDYAAIVENDKEMAEICFGRNGRIVECKYYTKDLRRYSYTMNIPEFRKKFQNVIEKLVPKTVIEKYLATMYFENASVFRGIESEYNDVMEDTRKFSNFKKLAKIFENARTLMRHSVN